MSLRQIRRLQQQLEAAEAIAVDESQDDEEEEDEQGGFFAQQVAIHRYYTFRAIDDIFILVSQRMSRQ